MGLTKQLRKLADWLDAPGYRDARRKRVPYELYRLFGRVNGWGDVATVLDVGANRGHFSRSAVNCFPKATVHAFEPLEVCQDKLVKTANRFGHIEVHQLALGETPGTVTMFENDYPDSSSLLPMTERHKELWPKTKNETKIKVKRETLDNLQNIIGPGPHFMKLDVQGYELHVLKGAGGTLKNTLAVMCEVCFEGLYEDRRIFPRFSPSSVSGDSRSPNSPR
jgi:FkbM family methyltransferase